MKKYIGHLWNKYDSVFGCEASDIYHNKYWDEEDSQYPPVSVSVYKQADTGRPHDILITSGMSWRPMNFGDTYQGDRWSTELTMYVDQATQDDINWLLWLSILPYIDDFALGFGHTVSYPEPLYKDSQLTNFLFLNTLVKNDANIFSDIEMSPYPVDLLWVIPITSSEYILKLEKGLDAVLDLFQEKEHPVTLDRQRKSYVLDS